MTLQNKVCHHFQNFLFFFVNFELSCFYYFLSRPYRSQFCKHKLRTRDLPPYSAKLGPLSPTFSCITKGKTFQVTFKSNNQQCLENRTLRWNQSISSQSRSRLLKSLPFQSSFPCKRVHSLCESVKVAFSQKGLCKYPIFLIFHQFSSKNLTEPLF